MRGLCKHIRYVAYTCKHAVPLLGWLHIANVTFTNWFKLLFEVASLMTDALNGHQ